MQTLRNYYTMLGSHQVSEIYISSYFLVSRDDSTIQSWPQRTKSRTKGQLYDNDYTHPSSTRLDDYRAAKQPQPKTSGCTATTSSNIP
eukprot:4796746-Amphidinium_carterae.1